MKQDRRVRYTKEALKQSLLDLMKEQPLEKITVKELCERADVNRSTFYVYYGSPQELLNAVLDEMYASIAAKPQNFDSLQSFLCSICESLMGYRDLMGIISVSGDLIGLLFRLVGIWEENFMTWMSKGGLDSERAALLYRYVSTGASFAIGTWVISGGMDKSAQQVAAELEQIILHGIDSYFT